jgi:hypothetical protein
MLVDVAPTGAVFIGTYNQVYVHTYVLLST